MHRLSLPALLLALLLPVGARADTHEINLTIEAGKHDRDHDPVTVQLIVPERFESIQTFYLRSAKPEVECLAQLTKPGLLAPALEVPLASVQRECHFLLTLKAGTKVNLIGVLDTKAEKVVMNPGFSWKDKGSDTIELRYNNRPVMSYVHPTLDDSSEKNREATFKVWHHLYSPDGSRIVTKGVGGQYTHHRALFYGFNKVTYETKDGPKTVDIWHCKDNVKDKKVNETHQSHDAILASEGGPVLGRHRLLIGWHGVGKEVFAKEEREMTIYTLPNGTLVEFASKLTPVMGKVKVDGDPQHAGFHFRADDEVSSRTKETIFIRPDGDGKPGATRNWDPKTKMGPVDLPWNGMSFMLGDKRYTAAYLDRPENPKEARYSEREYGRMGSYFEAEATVKKPLVVDYRIWLQEGQMKGAQIAALDAAFVEPVKVTVK